MLVASAVLSKIWNRTAGISEESTKLLLSVMSRCTSGLGRMRGRLPQHALVPGMVMDKTGTVGRCSNDVGIMSLPDGTHLAVSLFVKESTLDVSAREVAMANAARSMYDFYLFTNPTKSKIMASKI